MRVVISVKYDYEFLRTCRGDVNLTFCDVFQLLESGQESVPPPFHPHTLFSLDRESAANSPKRAAKTSPQSAANSAVCSLDSIFQGIVIVQFSAQISLALSFFLISPPVKSSQRAIANARGK